jgi:TonB family protein
LQGPVRVPTKEEQLAEERTQVAARIGGWTTEILARRRAEEPHDVYWRWMQDALAKGFAVDAGIGKLRVLVRIVQREDGSVESADLAGSSGNRSYDDGAIEQARSLGRNPLGVPPGGHRRTLWAFETDFLIFPPLPLAGCTLDSNLTPGECFYPFKKYGRPRVKLQAIY